MALKTVGNENENIFSQQEQQESYELEQMD